MSLFLIAEIGINHNGSMDLAKMMIDAAVDVYIIKEYSSFMISKGVK